MNLVRTPLTALPTSAAAETPGLHCRVMAPEVQSNLHKSCLENEDVCRFRGAGRKGAPAAKAESWKHSSISRKLESVMEKVSGKFSAPLHPQCPALGGDRGG